MKRTFGKGDDTVITNKKNAFRYPKDPEAVFPQHPDPVFIDRRTKAIPPEMLIKDKSMKKKNLKKKLHKEGLEKAFKEIHDRVEGTERDNDIIDLNNIDMDEELDKLTLGDKKRNTRKKVNSGMDLDLEESAPKARRSRRNTKKGKSYYIMNN
jgi:hypothetical protein